MNIIKFFSVFLILSCGGSDSFDLVGGDLDPIIIDVIDVSNEDIEITTVVNLNITMEETSGLINFDGKIITHNDSGSDAIMYEINVESGEVNRSVKVINVDPKDIEDIAQDDNFIYLCDIGNNSNTRKDQTIYKIKKSDYLSMNEVEAELISISYKEQTDFTKSNNATNFDAEAVTVVGNTLYLFTKNWGDNKTSVYEVPTSEGSYVLEAIDTYDINGLITGADYDPSGNAVFLTGYNGFIPFVVKLSEFDENNPLSGTIQKDAIAVAGSRQIEAICVNADGSFYISAEQSLNSPPVLYKMIY